MPRLIREDEQRILDACEEFARLTPAIGLDPITSREQALMLLAIRCTMLEMGMGPRD